MFDLNEIKNEFDIEISKIETLSSLEEIKIKYLSKQGIVSGLMSKMRIIPNDQKANFGKLVNDLKQFIEVKFQNKLEEIKNQELIKLLISEKIEIQLPGIKKNLGTIHPLRRVIRDLEDFFLSYGYLVAEGPELEDEHYNFTLMNMPKNHPAREMSDSFYVSDTMLLRTHTSPVQAREMLKANGKPLRIICPGKTYRRDADDPTHSHQFMQLEGLVVDKNINFSEFKGTLLAMIKHLFGDDREIRLRPSFFPFTEPSVEVDVVYVGADGNKHYIEVLGSGMVHENVLNMCGYDSKKFSGFAFGIGIERIAMLKYGIENIRHFYNNDIRFLKQFRGSYEN